MLSDRLFDLFKIEVIAFVTRLCGFLSRRGRWSGLLLLLLLILITHMFLHVPHLAAYMLGRIINGNDKSEYQLIKNISYEDVEK
jgi:hypothetical protein